MTEQEFFKKPNKKLLISDSFPHAESLIKRYVLLNNQPVVNIERETLESIANRIYKVYGDSTKTIINDTDATFIIDALLRKNKYAFLPEESIALTTSEVFYDAIKEIKYGSINEKHNVDRFSNDISLLLNDYNAYLKDNNLIDSADVIQFAIKNISVESLALSNNVSVGVTKNLEGHLRFIELELLTKICSIFNQSIQFIEYTLENQQIESTKINAHGFINEVNYIVQDIRKNNINFSEVSIYLSSSSYETMIKSLFDYYHINYHFVSGEPISLLSITSVINYALDFVIKLCDLKSIYNMLLTDAIKDEFKDLIPVLSYLKCDHFNIASYNGTKNNPLAQNLKQFLNLLLEIDDEQCDIVTLFNKLKDFVIYASKDDVYSAIKEKFEGIADDLKYVDKETCPTINKKVEIIKSFVSSIRLETEKEEACVNVLSLAQGFILNRKYNYLIGLSASQLSLKEIQSPILNDDELTRLLKHDNCYIALAENKNKEYLQSINTLINTASNGTKITYIYSSYEPVAFQTQAPSTLYVDAPGTEDNANYEIDAGALIHKGSQGCTSANKISQLYFSPSGLETFVQCPCQYLLHYTEEYGRVELAEYSNNWLQGGEYGTLCHLILQEYFQENNTPTKQKAFDENSYQKCLKKAVDITTAMLPFGNQNAVQVDIDRADAAVREYLKNYFQDTDGYLVVECEYDFTNDSVTEIFNIQNKQAVVKYKGKIDRIDVKADASGNLFIRTIDYKTSARSKISSKLKKGETFQGHIYDIAAKIYCLNHKNELEKRLGQNLNFNSASDLDNNVIFQYVFLKEKPANQNLIVTPEHEAEAITTLRKIISAIMEYNVDCDVNKTLENMNKGLGVVSEYTHSDCEYCQYSKHCRYKIENGENVYPKSL